MSKTGDADDLDTFALGIEGQIAAAEWRISGKMTALVKILQKCIESHQIMQCSGL